LLRFWWLRGVLRSKTLNKNLKTESNGKLGYQSEKFQMRKMRTIMQIEVMEGRD